MASQTGVKGSVEYRRMDRKGFFTLAPDYPGREQPYEEKNRIDKGLINCADNMICI